MSNKVVTKQVTTVFLDIFTFILSISSFVSFSFRFAVPNKITEARSTLVLFSFFSYY